MTQGLSSIRLLFLLALTTISLSISAQKTQQQLQELQKKILSDPKVADVRFAQERQTPSLILLKTSGVGYTRDQVHSVLDNFLSVRSGVDYLMPVKQAKISSNLEVAEFQQYYKGIKVEHARYKALIKDGVVQLFNGEWYNVPTSLTTQFSMAETQALSKAKARIGARKYAWEELDQLIQRNKANPKTEQDLQKELKDYQPKGELVYIKDYNRKGVAELKLAYKFNIYAVEPISRAWVYVDANDGRILLIDKIIKHIDDPSNNPEPPSVSATVQTRYAGSQVIRTKQISGNDPNLGLPLTSSHPTNEIYIPGTATYVLADDTRGNGIETYDLNGIGGLPLSVPALYLQGKSFTDADNNWTVAEHHRSPENDGVFEAENDDIAWDAHWGAEVVYDYWLAKHNRLSFDGNNGKIKSFIHYGPAYDNAFWNGAAMTYGDGSGPTAAGFKALTSLDVCGHEIGHGVCSYTSDLVYQGESGGMNEGFSDIWAACIEHFAMTRTGSTVPSGIYRPFYIGEQIGADYDHPLRRSDNPKAFGNPDTYGGINWINPDCTPTLANDECGVHTNLGVLVKWFFLITAGSKTGTRGPGTSSYYFADSDDEINDLGNTYKVNGLGFDVAENITFITETLLSSGATYAEARDVSIQVAKLVSGDACSAMVQSVTNAWYAVGVGEAFTSPCTSTFGFIFQPGASVSEAATPSGCSSQKTVYVPVLLPANSTVTITPSGTAKSGLDYTISNTSLSNTTNTAKRIDMAVTIKNDAVIESQENIILNIAVTNAGSSPVNQTYTITLTDDDVTPVIGSTEKVLLNETFTRADGFADPAGWNEQLEIPEVSGDPTTATGKNQWGIFDNKLAITGKEGLTDTQLPNGTYNDNSQSHTIIKSSLIDARGLSNLNIQFDFLVQGETDVQSGSTDIENLPVFDYMAVAYSLDGTNFTELGSNGFKQFASVIPASGKFTGNLPVSLGNSQFYLTFVWYNDTNAGGPFSASVDNLILKGTTKKIENDLNHNSRENLNAGQEVYFYTEQDGELVGKVKNNYTRDYGCSNVYVEKTGNGAFNLYQSKNALYKVADKVVRVETSLIYKASQTVTLYFTEQQLQALEAAASKPRTAFRVYHVDAASYIQSTASNTEEYAPTYAEITGTGGAFTITFTGKVNGSYALGTSVSVLGTENVANVTAEADAAGWKFERIYPNPSVGNVYSVLNVPKQQRIFVDVINVSGQTVYKQSESLPTGMNKIELRVNKLLSGNYMIRFVNEEGKLLNAQSLIKQ